MPSLSTLLTAALAAFVTITPGSAAPAPAPQASTSASSGTGYWLSQDSFHQNNPVWGNTNSAYKLYRNVKDYGATGDGSTDDTAAITKALMDGGACAKDCNSSTIYPKMVYFPPGTYVVSTPVQMPYNTQLIGDAVTLPTILASSTFQGMALLDSDPYEEGGKSNSPSLDAQQLTVNIGANWFSTLR